mgnify:CR=1 FL=1
MTHEELHKAAERDFGGQIEPEEMLKAEPYARRKLDNINRRYGTHHGDEYLAILISETVFANRLSHFTLLLYDVLKEDDGPDIGAKKEPHLAARPLPDTPTIPCPGQ